MNDDDDDNKNKNDLQDMSKELEKIKVEMKDRKYAGDFNNKRSANVSVLKAMKDK